MIPVPEPPIRWTGRKTRIWTRHVRGSSQVVASTGERRSYSTRGRSTSTRCSLSSIRSTRSGGIVYPSSYGSTKTKKKVLPLYRHFTSTFIVSVTVIVSNASSSLLPPYRMIHNHLLSISNFHSIALTFLAISSTPTRLCSICILYICNDIICIVLHSILSMLLLSSLFQISSNILETRRIAVGAVHLTPPRALICLVFHFSPPDLYPPTDWTRLSPRQVLVKPAGNSHRKSKEAAQTFE